MSKGRRKFSDLTRQEKVWVVGGTAGFFFMFASFLLFRQFFLMEDGLHILSLMKAGAILSGVRLLYASLFLIVGIPALILFSAIFCYFAHRSVSDSLKSIVAALAVSSLPLVFSAALLTLLDIVFSDAAIAIQAMLTAVTVSISVILTVRVLKLKKIQIYWKKFLA